MAKKIIGNKCAPCKKDTHALTQAQTQILLEQLDHWVPEENGTKIKKKFLFKNFYETMNFVNAIAWIANQENHHPDLYVTFNACQVCFYTHTIRGLSENDFICAKKIDHLIL